MQRQHDQATFLFHPANLQERRPTKTREYDWKIRAARGHDEKVVKATWHPCFVKGFGLQRFD